MMTNFDRWKRWIAPVLLGLGLIVDAPVQSAGPRAGGDPRRFRGAIRAVRSTAIWRRSRWCCWLLFLVGKSARR